MTFTPTRLCLALLLLASLALGATPYLGSPWPGVVLAGLSLLSHGLVTLMALKTANERVAALDGRLDALSARLEETEGDVRAMKNRKAFGG